MLRWCATPYGTLCATNLIKSKVLRLGDTIAHSIAHTQNYFNKKLIKKGLVGATTNPSGYLV